MFSDICRSVNYKKSAVCAYACLPTHFRPVLPKTFLVRSHLSLRHSAQDQYSRHGPGKNRIHKQSKHALQTRANTGKRCKRSTIGENSRSATSLKQPISAVNSTHNTRSESPFHLYKNMRYWVCSSGLSAVFRRRDSYGRAVQGGSRRPASSLDPVRLCRPGSRDAGVS